MLFRNPGTKRELQCLALDKGKCLNQPVFDIGVKDNFKGFAKIPFELFLDVIDEEILGPSLEWL